MRHAGGLREHMKIRLGLAILDAYPGLKAKDAVALAAKFYGRLNLDQMKAKILNAGGYAAAGIIAVDVHGAPEEPSPVAASVLAERPILLVGGPKIGNRIRKEIKNRE